MATAMVGGSFDPIHLGHLHLVHSVVESTFYRRFIFVPVGQNHFKPDARPADEAHRLEMIRLSFEAYHTLYPNDPQIELVADDCELERGGVSYTYDTVKYLYLNYRIKGRLAVVIGDDLLPNLKQWHAYEDLKELVTFVVIRREDTSHPFGDIAADLVYLDNPLLEDSSTMIRERCRSLTEGERLAEEIASLMPPQVARYVEEHSLYRA
jgi:nicotinate-nucleotide adenylyltransferase